MARTVKAVAAPSGGTKSIGPGRSFRMLSGSIGASTASTIDDTPLGDEKFESGQSDDTWLAQVRARETAEGLREEIRTGLVTLPRTQNSGPGWNPVPVVAPPKFLTDLTGLPDKFTLEIESRPNGWWKVTSPACHIGLFVAHQDLLTALGDAPGALAQILRLDGPVPAVKRGRRK